MEGNNLKKIPNEKDLAKLNLVLNTSSNKHYLACYNYFKLFKEKFELSQFEMGDCSQRLNIMYNNKKH